MDDFVRHVLVVDDDRAAADNLDPTGPDQNGKLEPSGLPQPDLVGGTPPYVPGASRAGWPNVVTRDVRPGGDAAPASAIGDQTEVQFPVNLAR